MLARTLTTLGRLRRRAGSATAPREDLIARYAAGQSFVDIGCLWRVHGALCFVAEDAGASAVTGVDITDASQQFLDEQRRRDSKVRFVRGDLHDAATVAEVGPHDVVWCSGVLYHAPHPLLTLERLRALTGQTLLLATETIPETPGRPNTCVFAPGRRDHPNAQPPRGPDEGYAPWYWGITPSALRTMLPLAGFEIVEEYQLPLHATLVAR